MKWLVLILIWIMFGMPWGPKAMEGPEPWMPEVKPDKWPAVEHYTPLVPKWGP